jgi:hypothetical protein
MIPPAARAPLTRRERERGIEGDQARDGVPDRGSSGQISGDRSEIANLPRTDAADEGAEGWKVPIEMGQSIGVGDRAADLDRVGRRRDAPQLVNGLERDHERQRLAILADAQPEIGAAREQERVRGLRHRGKERSERPRREKRLFAVTVVRAYR